MMKTLFTKRTLVAMLGGLCLAPMPAPAEPPPWAPAHGWRKKNDPYYVGYSGRKWEKDFGIVSGRCNTQAVGAVLGGVVGGAVGSQVGRGDTRVVATILGAVLGSVIGAKIGREIDDRDRACMGHALELAADRQAVGWTNESTGVAYRLVPERSFTDRGAQCRAFVTHMKAKDRSDAVKGTACRRGDGEWEFRS